jgi:creatinine amidohydrolase
MIWDQLTTVELDGLARTTPVVLPVAATEQHGPHLPLATDRLITEHFARRLGDELDLDVLVLPCISVGCSEHHLGFPGTLSVRHETLFGQLGDTLESVARHGFTNLVVLNGHGGNGAATQVFVESFGHRHPGCRVVASSWWRLAGQELGGITETGPGGVGHACEFETSLMLHFAPELVRTGKIAPGGNAATFDWAEGDMLRSSRASLYRDFREMTGGLGVYGDPTAASAEKGRSIEAAVLAELTGLVRSLAAAG